MRLQGRSIVVTGAGRNLGRASAEMFAREGAAIVVADINPADAEAVAAGIVKKGGRAIAIRSDVTKEADCHAMVAAAEKEFGALDGIFNNAGIMMPDDAGPVETPLASWEKTIAVNLTGVFLGCRAAIPAMLRAGRGAIVNMGSMAAFIGSATPQLAYATAKGGVVAMTQEIAMVYARQNIRANALCPGPVRTDLIKHLVEDKAALERRRVHMPLGRFGEPHEIAAAALFLMSDESSYMTGQSLLVDGGISRAYTTPLDE
jgi:NAD(P)-dependent dehydrogenase (short-subunit alcohol dehydrogenase family)